MQWYSRNEPNANDAMLFQSFSAQAAESLKNAMLFGEINRLATLDTLTGINNRKSFFDAAEKEFLRAIRYNHPLSIIMIDIDNFNKVNDGFGHQIGDRVIRIIAQRLESDLRGPDIIGRYGGEEIIILLPETGLLGAENFAERLRQIIENKPVILEDQKIVHVTVSMGAPALTGCLMDPDFYWNWLTKQINPCIYPSGMAETR